MVEPITEEKNAETTLLQHLYVPNPLRIYPQINLLLSMMKHIWGGGGRWEKELVFFYTMWIKYFSLKKTYLDTMTQLTF